ncbi:GntR family transcriptional regulator [Microtetraspora sp. NBRC 16547]|uniref:GntR family transcriptional regulator n=1 Tax=Microtetraspora sp. NBRC 16547 TaxID=3030993 RepID=UPI0025555D03|nr:GntR family transcriptional regulator [Microtetraspora sp. NBRC 16547]
MPTEISLSELEEVYALRRMIECDAARRSAPNYTDEHLSQLEASLVALETTHAQDRHGEEFFAAHGEFHWLLLQPYAGVYTERLLRQLWAASRRYIHMSIATRPFPTVGHHREIFEAALARDADLVTTRLDDHLRITEDSLKDAWVTRSPA